LPRRNYQFEKRQKDLSKKAKKEEKRQRRLERANRAQTDEVPPDESAVDQPPPE